MSYNTNENNNGERKFNVLGVAVIAAVFGATFTLLLTNGGKVGKISKDSPTSEPTKAIITTQPTSTPSATLAQTATATVVLTPTPTPEVTEEPLKFDINNEAAVLKQAALLYNEVKTNHNWEIDPVEAEELVKYLNGVVLSEERTKQALNNSVRINFNNSNPKFGTVYLSNYVVDPVEEKLLRESTDVVKNLVKESGNRDSLNFASAKQALLTRQSTIIRKSDDYKSASKQVKLQSEMQLADANNKFTAEYDYITKDAAEEQVKGTVEELYNTFYKKTIIENGKERQIIYNPVMNLKAEIPLYYQQGTDGKKTLTGEQLEAKGYKRMGIRETAEVVISSLYADIIKSCKKQVQSTEEKVLVKNAMRNPDYYNNLRRNIRGL